MKDGYGREIEYLRLSVTPRCNLRCIYCAPEGCSKPDELLSDSDIVHIGRAAAKAGIRYIKITGGEPLMRSGCAGIIRRLKSVCGIDEVTLTTNGTLLPQYAEEIIAAGTDRVNISLDTADASQYAAITGFDMLGNVEKGIDMLCGADIPVRLNCVLLGGINDNSFYGLLKFPETKKIDLRFIELMPVGHGREFSFMSSDTVYNAISRIYPLYPSEYSGNGPAVYFESGCLTGRIGFISAISHRFCKSCNRLRITADGTLKPCLSMSCGTDLKPYLSDEDELYKLLKKAVHNKPLMHCFGSCSDEAETAAMNTIGG